jgi:autotransporter-associated beta strand protein
LLNGASGSLGLAKGAGSGTLTVTAAQTFSGGLVVSNGTVLVNNASGSGTGTGAVTVVDGTLGGTGIIAGSVSVQSAGNLAPGNSIGDLTINGTLTLGGTFTAEVDTGAAPNTDRILGASAKNYGGTLVIVNQGSALTAADTFQVFPAGIRTGTFSLLPPTPDNNPALAWNTSTLTTDGTLRITNVGSGPSTTPTNIVSSVSGGNLTLTWPDTHIGWTLQAQTNSRSVGLSSNWSAFDGGYTTTNEAVIPIDKTTPTVFFRLFYQTP